MQDRSSQAFAAPIASLVMSPAAPPIMPSSSVTDEPSSSVPIGEPRVALPSSPSVPWCAMPDYAPPTTTTELLVASAVGALSVVEAKHAPPSLFIAGDESLLRAHPRIAIVGSRSATAEGCRRSARLARELVAAGAVVVSGLAKGIDAAAHEAAIAAGGRTIAVIGTPLDRCYPAAHAKLQETIYRHHLLVSQFAPSERTVTASFVKRNRTMALLSDASVIVEAQDGSGSLSQAAETQRLGRPLFLMRSVVENATLSWPKRFLNAGAFVLESTAPAPRCGGGSGGVTDVERLGRAWRRSVSARTVESGRPCMQDRSSLGVECSSLAVPSREAETLALCAVRPTEPSSSSPTALTRAPTTPGPLVLTYREGLAEDAAQRQRALGTVVHGWRVLEPATGRGDHKRFVCACESCHELERFSLADLEASPFCLACGANVPAELDERTVRVQARLAAVPRLDPELPFGEDLDAQAWVTEHPDGSTLEEVGRAFGVTRERVRQLEEKALAKLTRELDRAGIGPEMLEHLFRTSW